MLLAATDALIFQLVSLISTTTPTTTTSTSTITNFDVPTIHKTLTRYCMLALELAVIKVRCGKEYLIKPENIIELKEHLLNKKLITLENNDEFENMLLQDRSTSVYLWIHTYVNKLGRDGGLPPGIYLLLLLLLLLLLYCL